MRYMVVEHFRDGRTAEIYRRFAEKGRILPEKLIYIDSWVSADLKVCFQLMETDDFNLFSQWTQRWEELVEFEIAPVLSSAEAVSKVS